MDQQISYSALHAVVTKEQIRDRQQNTRRRLAMKAWFAVIVCLLIIIALIRVWAAEVSAEQWLGVFLVNFSVPAAIGLIIWWISAIISEKAMERRIRFENFASDNSLTYVHETASPEYEGVIFTTGSQRKLYDRFRADGFEIGNYRYTVQHGKSSTTYKYGYICIKLQRNVAHMLLDSKSNNTNVFGASLSNLPVAMRKDQTLSLEGDFNNYFTLYAPKEYERDALYIFTPDLMALLIDNVAQFDVEVVDDQLFVYGPEFQLTNGKMWQRLFAIITNVGQKTISQTDYYADEKVGNRDLDIVADEGRRLRKGLSWQVIAFIIFFIVSTILQVMAHV